MFLIVNISNPEDGYREEKVIFIIPCEGDFLRNKLIDFNYFQKTALPQIREGPKYVSELD